jgi:tetratricopeptide (TPR) repeat protein
MSPGADRWEDEPAWVSETTWEWETLPAQRPPEPRRPAADGRAQPADRRMQPPAVDVPRFDLPGDRRGGAAPPLVRQAPPPFVDARSEPTAGARPLAARPEVTAVRIEPGPAAAPTPPSGIRAAEAPGAPSGWFATRPRPVPPPDAAGPPEPAGDNLTWTVSTGTPDEITGEIVTGEIVDEDTVEGEVIRAEVVATGPVVPDDRRTSLDSGLGRRLKASGLGRATVGPPPTRPAVTQAPAASYVGGARPDWFAGTAPYPVVSGRGNASARRPGEKSEQHEGRLADPERILAAFSWSLDPETLRELPSDPDRLRAVRDRLTDKVEYAERDAIRARLLSLRAVVSRVLGDLGPALADGRAALGHAEATGELRRTAIAAARLAHVLQWCGEYAEADRLFAEANSIELPDRLRAEMHELAGRSAYEQGRHLEALQQFEAALSLRDDADADRAARVAVALDAILRRVRERGWGPYPRTRDEVLMRRRAPQPFCDVRTGLWGYASAVPARYRDAQPFAEEAAWVRRPGAHTWELIGADGRVLIDSAAGYLRATGFSGGLAWVSREPAGGWFAVDQHNRVIIPGAFEEVRPFRRGVAPVRRGGWGAIDRHGRMVVPAKYQAFATVLAGGRKVEGFTDEGLAVVDAGDRLGVVDQRGQVVVAPAYPVLVIHPVAFLIGDGHGRWGALDRRGEPLIDVMHAGEEDVTHAIDRLLADTRPVL